MGKEQPRGEQLFGNSELFKREGCRVTLSRKTAKSEALPKGWRRMKIIDFSPLQRGFDLPASQIEEGAYPVVYSNGINNYHSEYKSKAPGVVTGRSGTIGEVTYVIQDYWPHNTSLWVTDFKDNHPKFVFYALQNLRLDRFHAGSGVPTLNRNDVHKQSILVPPSSEQKAIVSLLETWDTAIEKTEALIAAKEKQFKWLLKTLISGQQDNPEWQKVKLGQFGTFYKGRGITKADLVEDGIPCLRYAEIYTKYDSIVNELSSSVSPNAAIKATPIQSGDIIFAASGETAAEIGKAIAFVGHYPAVAGGDTVIFRDHGQESAYLAHMLNSADVARQKTRLGKGQSVVHIHVPELFQVEVSLPPLHAQRKIVKILATWDTAIEKTKALAEQYRAQKRGLMQKLLTGKWRIRLGDN